MRCEATQHLRFLLAELVVTSAIIFAKQKSALLSLSSQDLLFTNCESLNMALFQYSTNKYISTTFFKYYLL